MFAIQVSLMCTRMSVAHRLCFVCLQKIRRGQIYWNAVIKFWSDMIHFSDQHRFTGATFDNRQLDVVGWGSTEYGGGLSTKLLKASVYGYPFSNCNNAYGNQLISSQLCTYASGRDACQYDSGGPVYFTFDGILYDVGVISFGESCASSKPGVNSRITSFLDWIQSQTPEVNYCIK